jgi:isopenicillin-N epimerase
MALGRRAFLSSTAGLVSGMVTGACRTPGEEVPPPGTAPPPDPEVPALSLEDNGPWEQVRRQFHLADDYIHMSALFISSHPQPVREAIEEFRAEIDRMPVVYLQQQNRRRQNEARAAAARYLGVEADDIALTDSTTMGIGLLYNGIRLREGQEILTTDEDYYVTHEAVRVAAERAGASVRQIPLYEDSSQASRDEIVERIGEAIRPETRVLALTWVHSSTGMKLPLREIAQEVRRGTRNREDGDRVLICVDGVHGFGIEDVRLGDLGIDFFAAGCHKWLFGPRGTGILWGRGDAWTALKPIIPSFMDDRVWDAWLENNDVTGPTTAARMTPGGFKAFEHQWAMPAGFEFHRRIGKARVQGRTHGLNRRLKEGLAGMDHIRLHTPMGEELSSGLVCFTVEGMDPWTAVRRLRDRRLIGTVTPYARRLVRFAPSIRNTEAEVDRALEAIADLGARS